MALSNIFREPIREISETAVGLLVAAPVLVGEYYFACYIATIRSSTGEAPRLFWPLLLR